MTNSSSSSRRKILTVFLTIIIVVVVFFVAVDLSLSLILNNQLNKAKASLKSDSGLELDYSFAIFDIFYGVSINNLSLSNSKDKIFDVGSIKLSPDLLSTILKRKFLCKEALVQDLHVYKVEELDKEYLSFLIKSIKDSQEMFKSALVRFYDVNFMDVVNFDLGGYIALAQSKVLLSRGKLRILKSAYIDKTDFDQSNSLLDTPLDYAFESTYLDGDFVINKLELIGFSARLVMSGRINDYQDTFNLDIMGELRDCLLEDFKQLNNEYVYARGILSSDFSIKGPMESAEFNTNLSINNCSLRIMDFFKIDKLNSDLVWDNKGFRSQNISGLLDGSPITLSLDIGEAISGKKINLQLSGEKIALLENLVISYQGELRSDGLGGDLEVQFEHEYDKKTLSKYFNFKDLNLIFGDLNLHCDSVQMKLGEQSQLQEEKRLRDIALKGLSAEVAMVRDGLELYNVEAEVFGGNIKGSASFRSQEGNLYYDGKMILSGLSSEDAFRELISDDFKLSGLLSGTIVINSKLRESLSGDIQIVDGELEDNSILIAISDFFAIPSLRSVAFSNLKIIFYKIWNKYDAKISLFSPDVSIYLDNKSFAGETLDGYLLVKLATALTDESPRFRRLFKYIGYKEPTVYFPFQLKGYLAQPRIEWLENEFKEKLQDFLPESNQKLLQEALSKMVEEF